MKLKFDHCLYVSIDCIILGVLSPPLFAKNA
jgi:hypothetical protein